MERLTNRVGRDHVLYTGVYRHYDGGDIPAEMSTDGARDVLRRLADYEDTGLEPEEILCGINAQKPIDAAVEAIPQLVQAIVENMPALVAAYMTALLTPPTAQRWTEKGETMAKQNAFLAKIRAQAQAKEAIKTDTHVEIDTIAMLLAINQRLHVGPGRADGVLNDFLAWKMEIAEAITQEYDEDQSKKKEVIIVRRDLAKRIKEILGPDAWEKRKTLFPFLRDYWEIGQQAHKEG